jgi:hypothetical protein
MQRNFMKCTGIFGTPKFCLHSYYVFKAVLCVCFVVVAADDDDVIQVVSETSSQISHMALDQINKQATKND